ncbi:NAD(P)-dependent oxidoreductase [Luteococcus peritonei]|uniref:NAD-dependent epimerase/dehydratase family protein n=1 Tax=Luteococcus peritonei TaxID=88874 RepID=A0ABW4S0E8_9ACTN
MTKRRILITGATGNIGQLLSERLQDDYEVLMQGRTPRTPRQEKELLKVDLNDFEAVRGLMDGVDTVVHLAGAASPESTWEEVLEANIIGLRNVLEAAQQGKVRRVVFASSNHAMGGYDRDGEWPVYPHQIPRGDSLYGMSKAMGETMCRFYHDEHGLEVICLRIGWMSGDPMLAEADILHAMWLSEDDCEQVVRRSIEAATTWGLFYAISDNPNRRWDLTNTMLELGYRPQDTWTDEAPEPEEVVEGGEAAPTNWPEDS